MPASISVLNERQLEDRNISDAANLAVYTPSLTANIAFGEDNASFSLRGFQQDIGTSPTVGVYFADVVRPRGGFGGSTEHGGEGAGPGLFFDLQNVQVLKGPQGTLFGRDTTGGAILLEPKMPTDKFEGYAEVSGGNFGLEETQAVLNVPISDRIRVRLGFDQKKRTAIWRTPRAWARAPSRTSITAQQVHRLWRSDCRRYRLHRQLHDCDLFAVGHGRCRGEVGGLLA